MRLETPAEVRHQVLYVCPECGRRRWWDDVPGASPWGCEGGCIGFNIRIGFELDANGNPRVSWSSVEGRCYPAWIPCDNCEDFWCRIHEAHVFECACPPLEEWGDVDPYCQGGPPWPDGRA